MAGHIASAFVQIRPDTTGFKAEAEREVKHGLSGVGRIIGGAFAAVGLEQVVTKVAEAAASQQEELAVVRTAIKATDSAWVVHGKTVSDTLREQAVKFGFTVSDLAQGFTRIQVSTKDSAKTFSLLDQAMNISRARHLGLAQAAVVVAKAQSGNVTGLQRLGIVIPKVTANYDSLKAKVDEARAGGAKFTKQQELDIKAAYDRAKALDQQATKTQVLAEIQGRFGGQSARFAATAEGSSERFHEAVNELEVAVGNGLLPTLTQAAAGATKFFKELADGGQVQAFAASTAQELASGYRVFRAIAETVAPPIVAIAKALGEVAHEAGGGGIVAFALGFKTVSAAIAVDASIRARWAKIVAAGSGTTAEAATAEHAESVALAELTAALAANTEALAGNSIATAADTTSKRLLIASSAGVVIAEREITVSSIAASAAIDAQAASTGGLAVASRGLFALAGGWTTVIAVGLGAAAFGIYKLVSAEDSWDRANRRVQESTAELDRVTQRAIDSRQRLAFLTREIPHDKLAVAQAKLNEETAKSALLTSKAAQGSSEYRQLQIGVLQAIQARKDAEKQLNADQDERTKTAKTSASADRQAATAVRARAEEFKSLARAARESTKATAPLPGRIGVPNADRVRATADLAAQHAAAERFARAASDSAEKQKNTTLRRNEELLAALARQTGKVPTPKQIRFIIDNKDAKATLGGLLFALDTTVTKGRTKAKTGGHSIGHDYAQGIAKGLTDDQGSISAALIGVLDGTTAAGKKHIGAHSPSEVTRDEIGRPIAQGIAAGIDADSSLVTAALKRVLAAAIRAKNAAHPQQPARKKVAEEKVGEVTPTAKLAAAGHRDGKTYTDGFEEAVKRLATPIPRAKAAPPEPDRIPRARPRSAATPERDRIPRIPAAPAQKFAPKIELAQEKIAATIRRLRSAGHSAGVAYGRGIIAGVGEEDESVFAAVAALLTGAIDSGKTAIGARSPSEASRTGIGHAISDGIALGILDRNGAVVKVLTNQVDDAITAGVQAVRDAVNSAKQNLNSIGGSLADDLGRLFDKRGETGAGAPTGAQAKRLKELLAKVHAGDASDETIRLAQSLSNQAVEKQSIAQQAGGSKTEAITRKIADLTDLFNRGSISEKAFERRLDSILKQAGATPGRAKSELGIAFSDQLRADIRGLKEQARALEAGPRVPGTGLEPTIVKPLETIREQQRNIADAAANQRAQQLAEAKQQTAEQKRANKHLADIAAHTKGTATTADVNRWIKAAERHPKAAIDALIAASNRHGR